MLLLVLALVAGLLSCNKFLDVRPKSQVKEDDLFSNKNGFIDALTGIYTQMTHRAKYGENLTFGLLDVLAQYYQVNTNASHAFYYAALYDYESQGVKARIDDIWSSLYNTIANDNNLLANIDRKRNLFSEQEYNLIKGEALGLRAFMHFDLLRAFGPVYLTGAEKPAIPYVTELSKNTHKVLKASVVVDSVISDLNRAVDLLSIYKDIDKLIQPEVNLNQPLLNYRQNHFNYWAAKAILARVYLYKGDKVKALEAATEVIHSEKFKFVTQTALTAGNFYKDRTFTTEQIFSLSDYQLIDPVDTYFKGNANDQIRLTMSGTQRDQIFEVASGGSSDFRYAYLWEINAGIMYPTRLWQQSDASEEIKNLLPLITLPEMYYIAAECTNDPATAVSYLNTVRENRGILDLPNELNQAQLRFEIFKAYQKELFLEGQLFFYYKRLNVVQLERTTIDGSDKVYVFPLPDNEVQYGDQSNN